MAISPKSLKNLEKGTWKKGQSGNPKGKPRTPEDIKHSRKFNQFEFERAVSKLLFISTGRL